jgi:ribosomal protein L33
MIKKIKLKSSEQYKNIYLHTKSLMEQVELLTAQKEQLTRRLRMHEPQI